MKSNLPTPNLEMQDTILLTNLILLSLVLFLGSFIAYALYRTYKAEQKRKAYTPIMKHGDKVCTPVMSGNVRGEILEVKDTKVRMIIEVPRSRVYLDEENS